MNQGRSTGTFMSATEQPFSNDGEFNVPFRSHNGYAREVDFLNAPVSMPIVSSRRWNQTGHEGTLGGDYGSTCHLETGETDPLLCRNGVYFMKMNVKHKYLEPTGRGFGRPGIP